jgi:hypothetical protein
VWGRMVRIPKVPCTKIMMAMLTLSCYKIKKIIYIKEIMMIKKEKRGKIFIYRKQKREK